MKDQNFKYGTSHMDVFESGCEAIVIPVSNSGEISDSFMKGLSYLGREELAMYRTKTKYSPGEIYVCEADIHSNIRNQMRNRCIY